MFSPEKSEMAIGLAKRRPKPLALARLSQCCPTRSQNHPPIQMGSGGRRIAIQLRENLIERLSPAPETPCCSDSLIRVWLALAHPAILLPRNAAGRRVPLQPTESRSMDAPSEAAGEELRKALRFSGAQSQSDRIIQSRGESPSCPHGFIGSLSRWCWRRGQLLGRIVFSSDGKTLCTGNDLAVHAWDTATGKEIHRFRHHEDVRRHLSARPASGYR